MRWKFNFFPAYRGTGGRITYVASDFGEVRIRIPLSWRTRNYVGTIYGGSLYGAVDPMYMIMLIKLLGPAYVVWDKSAAIRFLKPGRSTLTARFVVTEEEVETIRRLCEPGAPIDRVYNIEIVDAAGVPHALVEKTIYIRKKSPPGERSG